MSEPNDRDEWIAAQVARIPEGLVDEVLTALAPRFAEELAEQLAEEKAARRRSRVA